MAIVFDYEKHDYAMQLIKATLTFDSASISATTTHSYYGYVTQVVYDHDGSTQPSDNWDLVVTDDTATDVLNGKGANIDKDDDHQVITQADLDNGMACHGQLTFSGTNGGTGSGICVVYLYIARYQ